MFVYNLLKIGLALSLFLVAFISLSADGEDLEWKRHRKIEAAETNDDFNAGGPSIAPELSSNGFDKISHSYFADDSSIVDINSETNNDGCPPFYFLKLGDLCLHLGKFEVHWEQAKKYCYYNGAQLASFRSEKEAELITNFIRSETKLSVWLGATDDAKEGDWRWLDGTKLKTNKALSWFRREGSWKEPSNTTQMNCLVYQTIFGSIADAECGDNSIYKFLPLCQIHTGKKPDIPTTNPNEAIAEPVRACPHPFEREGDLCLYVLGFKKVPWQEGKEECELIGGHLVMSKSKQDSITIRSYFKARKIDDAWLGGTDHENEGTWKWIDGSIIEFDEYFDWGFNPYSKIDEGRSRFKRVINRPNSNLTPSNFSLPFKYKQRQPDGDTSQNCLSYFFNYVKNVLGDDYCSSYLRVVCQTEIRLPAPAVSVVDCPENFRGVGNKCLHVDDSQALTWVEARKYCQKLSSDLVMLDEANQVNVILQFLKSRTAYSVWLGASDRAIEGSWKWLNGKEVALDGNLNWYRGSWVEPSNGTALSDCMILYNGLEKLGDAGCNDLSLARFPPFCEIRTEDPEKFMKVGDFWLHLNENLEHTWDQANEYCQRIDGHLASFKSIKEAKLIWNFVKGSSVWLGAIDHSTKGNWYWLDGTKLRTNSMFSWYPSSSKNSIENRKCLFLKASSSSSTLNEEACDQSAQAKLPPLCQKRPRQECGLSPHVSSVDQIQTATKIVGGTESIGGTWPWMVAFLLDQKLSQVFCGGSLIGDRYVLTAAHCFEDLDEADYREVLARIGEHNVWDDNDEAIDFKIIEVHTHKFYEPDDKLADIAIVKLDDRVLPHPDYTTICLPEPNDSFFETNGVVIGFGLEDANDFESSSNVLMEVVVKVYKEVGCKMAHKHRIYKGMMCAGSNKGGKDSCRGDSGGPFVLQKPGSSIWFQAGIVSWGVGCGSKKYPGVYTKVNFFIGWICSYTQNCACPDPYIQRGNVCLFANLNRKMNYQEAEKYCSKVENGYLAIYKTREQSKQIIDYIYSIGSVGVWLGGTDLEEEGTWKRRDGSIITGDEFLRLGNSFNSISESNDGLSENCMFFNGNLEEGVLDDDSCLEEKYPLCQFDWSNKVDENIVLY